MSECWKVGNFPFWEGRVLKNSPQKFQEFPPHSFSQKNWFEVLHMPGVCDYHLPFIGDLSRMINYNFHAHVQYCITIQYLSCSIDIYRNVKDVKCHNFGKLGISHLEKEGFCKNLNCQKSGKVFSTFILSTELIWGPPMPGVWDIINL